jgi:pyruvate/2-oxoglutarate dehydrogenase complex dihydrolipoamide dehydrogenase (E3) component
MVSILPQDSFNERLLQNVHPTDWVNPTPMERYNIVVVGGGTAGLIAAAVASSLGAKTALIERQFMGGDCLNVGCVPSKGLIRGARAAAERAWQREAGLLTDAAGSTGDQAGSEIDFSAVMERLRRIRSEISGHDSAARYRDEFGVDVFLGDATFTGRRSVTVAGTDSSSHTLTFSKALIATGARAAAPPIPGLDTVEYVTNENIFNLTELPRRLVVIGAGPIGCEMAQSFARLGSTVEVVEMAPRILPREDPDVAETVQTALLRDGVRLHLSAAVSGVRAGTTGSPGEVIVTYNGDGETREVVGDRLLVAIGRAPNVDGLGLDAAGVRYHSKGVEVNKYLQTSNRRIYAAGDVASPYQFTHIAEATAGIVVQNALFARTARFDRVVVPWSTYTSPEVAHVGVSESQAERDGVAVDVFRHDMKAVDRARLDGETEGFVKIIVQKGKTRILGATLVGAHAGEMIAEIVLAMQNGLGIDKLAGVIHPYPTESEAVKRAAAGYLKAKLTPTAKRLMKAWFTWTR